MNSNKSSNTTSERFAKRDECVIAEVSPIERLGDGSYTWTVETEFDTKTYITNPSGEGVFEYDEDAAEVGRQVRGNCDFSLRGVASETRRRRVVREFAII